MITNCPSCTPTNIDLEEKKSGQRWKGRRDKKAANKTCEAAKAGAFLQSDVNDQFAAVGVADVWRLSGASKSVCSHQRQRWGGSDGKAAGRCVGTTQVNGHSAPRLQSCPSHSWLFCGIIWKQSNMPCHQIKSAKLSNNLYCVSLSKFVSREWANAAFATKKK